MKALKPSAAKISGQQWCAMTTDAFMQQYLPMLKSLAAYTGRINAMVVTQALTELGVGLTPSLRSDFATKVTASFSRTLDKRRNAGSGSRMPSHYSSLLAAILAGKQNWGCGA